MFMLRAKGAGCACRFITLPDKADDWQYNEFNTEAVVKAATPGKFFSLSQPLFKGN